MKFTIVKYHDVLDYTECLDEQGNTHRLDLTGDASFKEILGALEGRSENTSYKEVIDSFAGKTFECEETFPYIPCHFVRNAKLI